MSSNYRTYLCLETHVAGGKFYKKGLPYFFASAPGDKFVFFNDNVTNPRGVDLDGTWFPGVIGFDDFSFSATQGKQGANDLPPYDFDDMGIAFPANNTAQVLYMNQLASHRMVSGPNVIWYPHLHYFQDEEEIPVFEYRYRFTPPFHQVPAFSAWIPTVGTQASVYTEGKIQQIMIFPELIVGDIGIAAAIDVQLRRNDNIVTGAVVVKTFDFHVPFDAPLGSGREFIK